MSADPAHPVRAAFKSTLVQRMKEKPVMAGVQCQVGWPGDQKIQKDAVIVGKTTGPMEMPLSMAGRKDRNDFFTITVFFQSARQGTDTTTAEQRVDDLFSAFDDVVADDPTLGFGPIVQDVAYGTREGPDSALTSEGVYAWCSVELHVHSRLH